jgi:hypothetical protein
MDVDVKARKIKYEKLIIVYLIPIKKRLMSYLSINLIYPKKINFVHVLLIVQQKKITQNRIISTSNFSYI